MATKQKQTKQVIAIILLSVIAIAAVSFLHKELTLPNALVSKIGLFHYGSTTLDNPAHDSKFDYLIVDPHVTNLAQVRNLNPDIVVLFYTNLVFMRTSYDDWAEVNQHEDWFLHNINGVRIVTDTGAYGMDITKQGWRDHYIQHANNQMVTEPNYDGVFVDNVWSGFLGVYNGGYPDWVGWTLIPPQPNWHDDTRAFLSQINANLKPSATHGQRIGMYNGRHMDYLENINGQCIEDWLLDSVLTPLEWIDYLWEQSGNTKGFNQPNAHICALVSSTESEQNFLYAYATFLLAINGANAFFAWNNYWATSMGYYPEMDYDLGNATSPCYQVNADFFCRDFQHAKVIVNFSNDTAYTINVGETEYSVSPNSGLIVMLIPSAHVFIEHTYRGDLEVDIGVGDPSSPSWSQRIWNGEGWGEDNLDLTVDLSGAMAYLPPSTINRWFLRVYDHGNYDQGRIVWFNITYERVTYSSTDVPVPINDLQTNYAYIPS